jgi:hypothetical protein
MFRKQNRTATNTIPIEVIPNAKRRQITATQIRRGCCSFNRATLHGSCYLYPYLLVFSILILVSLVNCDGQSGLDPNPTQVATAVASVNAEPPNATQVVTVVVSVNAEPPIEQVVGNYTLKIQDAHRENKVIVVGFVLIGGQGVNSLLYNASLKDDQGAVYSLMSGKSNNGGYGVDLVDLAFDGSPSDNSVDTHRMYLTVDVYDSGVKRPSGGTDAQVIIKTVQTPTAGTSKVVGPFILDLGQVPYRPARSSLVAMTSTVEGVGVALERVIVTSSNTLVYLRVLPPSAVPGVIWFPHDAHIIFVEKNPNKQVYTTSSNAQGCNEGEDSTAVCTFATQLYDKDGQWYLGVESLGFLTSASSTPAPHSTRPAQAGAVVGPWEFQFTVPPASTEP